MRPLHVQTPLSNNIHPVIGQYRGTVTQVASRPRSV